jgi:hypothetical protein
MNYWLIPTYILALALCWLGNTLARKFSKSPLYNFLVVLGVMVALPGIIFSMYYVHLFHEVKSLYEFRSWPASELSASGAGFLAGLLHGRFSSHPRFTRIAGRWFFPGALVLGLFIPYVKPIILAPRWSEFRDNWSDGVCLQSYQSSCGPACAATLLAQNGIRVTEKELAQECHTCKTSTESWYLARALRRRGMKVSFVLEQDARKPWPYPAIAGVQLPKLGHTGHFITILGHTNDTYIIGDPLVGKLLLPSARSDDYVFTGVFLVVQ